MVERVGLRGRHRGSRGTRCHPRHRARPTSRRPRSGAGGWLAADRDGAEARHMRKRIRETAAPCGGLRRRDYPISPERILEWHRLVFGLPYWLGYCLRIPRNPLAPDPRTTSHRPGAREGGAGGGEVIEAACIGFGDGPPAGMTPRN